MSHNAQDGFQGRMSKSQEADESKRPLFIQFRKGTYLSFDPKKKSHPYKKT